jgi:hypothetical protein
MKDCVFIGIDQTGAVNSKGKPKKLPMAVLSFQNQEWQIETHFIRGLHAEEFKHLKNLKIIAVDSVLGLPHKVFPKNKTLRDLFKQALGFEFNKKAYGMEAAYQFFQTFLQNKIQNEFPTRVCEQLAKANSVFQKHPFQKNIGCGTFRIWKELGQNSDWFHLYPQDGDFSKLTKKPVIMEGYPSLIWKNLIQSNSRKTEALLKHLKQNKMNLLNTDIDADTADAIVLSLGAFEFYKNPKLVDRPHLKAEGWILSLD